MVSLNFVSWNQLDWWLRQVDSLKRAGVAMSVHLDDTVPG
jgi:hypothetical protein